MQTVYNGVLVIKNNAAGIELDNITSTSGYNQITNIPTYFVNGSSSCISVIFSSNESLIKNCGDERSLHEKCHHNIIYGSVNFSTALPHPNYR